MTLAINCGAGAAFVNNIGVVPRFARWKTASGFSVSGSEASGYSYTQTGAIGSRCTNASHRLPASIDGSFRVKMTALPAGASPILYTATINNSPANYDATTVWGVYLSGGAYRLIEAGAGNIAPNAAPSRNAAVGDLVRIRRIGSAGVCEISSDNGATWALYHNFTNASSAALYPVLEANSSDAGMVIGPLVGEVVEAV